MTQENRDVEEDAELRRILYDWWSCLGIAYLISFLTMNYADV
jgi:hypothetical protein